MERLIKLQADGKLCFTDEKTSIKDCLRKLSKLEDLEEQIGMPLLEYYNIIGKHIYVVSHLPYWLYIKLYSDKADKYFKDELYDYPTKETIVFTYMNKVMFNHWEELYYYPINELGKTWFFTIEDAVAKLKELKNGS